MSAPDFSRSVHAWVGMDPGFEHRAGGGGGKKDDDHDMKHTTSSRPKYLTQNAVSRF
jgi:hypothetical protein